MSQGEYDHLLKVSGIAPDITEDATRCIYLSEQNRCTVYNDRPTVCRLYGVDRLMPCPFGCVPERYISPEEGHKILGAVEKVCGTGQPTFNIPQEAVDIIRDVEATRREEAKRMARQTAYEALRRDG